MTAVSPLLRLRSVVRRKAAAAARRVRVPLPLPVRVALVRRLSSNLLLQAIGNLEGRDEFFWLSRQAWAEAHRVLGIHPSRDRFLDTGWEFGLETEICRVLHKPLLASAYQARRDRRLTAWLDEFVSEHWLECLRSYRYARAHERAESSRAADLHRRMHSNVLGNHDRHVLPALSSALADEGFNGRDGVGLVIMRPKPPQAVHYVPVLERLRAVGIPIMWLGVDPETHGGDVRVRAQAWGLEVWLPLPSPEELISTDPRAQTEYDRLLERIEAGLRHVPLQRTFLESASASLPASVYTWLAASLVARHVLDVASLRFVHTPVDKDVAVRAFVVEARKRRIPSSYYYGTLALGAPNYWPFSDRILVSNGARVERLIECLGVPKWRIDPVGDLETNAVLREIERAAELRARGSDFCLTFLMKWPAETNFGSPEDMFALLRELVDADGRWTYVLRPHPRDTYDYGWLREAFQGRVRVSGSKYGDSTGLAEAIVSATLVVTVLSNAAYPAIAAGKPTVIYNPDPKTNLGHDRLFACHDLPGQLRLVTNRDELVRLLRRVIAGQEPHLLAPEPLKPSLARFLFYSLDGRTADRIAEVLLKN